MSDIDLQPIKERLSKASPGPWTANDIGEVYAPTGDILGQCFDNVDSGLEALDDEPSYWNTQLFAHSRQDIEALVAEVERLHLKNLELQTRLAKATSKPQVIT